MRTAVCLTNRCPLSFSHFIFLKQPTLRPVGLERNLLMLCFLSPLFDTAFPLFHEWYPDSLGQEIKIKGFLFLVFPIKRNSTLVDIISLIKLFPCFLNFLLKINSVHLLFIVCSQILHLFWVALFWGFFWGGYGGCCLQGSFCDLLTWCLLLILVPFYVWGFILQFGSHLSGSLRMFTQWVKALILNHIMIIVDVESHFDAFGVFLFICFSLNLQHPQQTFKF